MTAARSSTARPITISAPSLGHEVEALVLEVLRSGQIAQGPMVARLEAQCAAMAGTRHAVAVANGTLALEGALEVLGVGPGDEVITSPLTFGATLNSIIRSGATARFADVRDDFTIDPQSVADLISPRTKLLLPVHLYGLMADMTALSALASRRGIEILEDAAQAHGATQDGRPAGSFGTGCFSFYATKNVTSAEGGMVTTDSDQVDERLRTLRNQGMAARYDYVTVGRNMRLTDVAAALAIPQMERLPEINAARNRNAALLTQLIAAANTGVVLPEIPPGRTHVWHQYTVLVPAACDRDAVADQLNHRGIGAGAYYPRLVWDYPPYRGHPQVIADATPRAAILAGRCLSVPVHPGLSEPDIEQVAAALVDAAGTM